MGPTLKGHAGKTRAAVMPWGIWERFLNPCLRAYHLYLNLCRGTWLCGGSASAATSAGSASAAASAGCSGVTASEKQHTAHTRWSSVVFP